MVPIFLCKKGVLERIMAAWLLVSISQDDEGKFLKIMIA